MNPAIATYEEDRYTFRWADGDVVITLDRLADSKAGLSGEIAVSSGLGKLHSPSRFNVLAPQTRASLARTLTERDGGVDWTAAIEQVCALTIQRWREGEPIIDLRDVPTGQHERWLYQPWLEYGGPTVLFADGGVGKSTFALIIATSIASGIPLLGDGLQSDPRPVLYLDWETSADIHAERLEAICRASTIGGIPPIYYQRMFAGLPDAAHAIRRRIVDKGIGLVVVDSLGAARAGEPESAEATLKLFNAARSFGVPWIGIDHVTKAAGARSDKPFGSAFTHNMARLTWGAEKIGAEDDDSGAMYILLTNHKSNNGRLQRRRAYAIAIVEDDIGNPYTISIKPQDIRDIPSMMPRLTQKDQIANMLKDGKASVEEIEGALLALNIIIKPNAIRAVMSRYKDIFVPILGAEDRIVRWGLLSKVQSS